MSHIQPDVRAMNSDEVNQLLMDMAAPSEPVAMPVWVAEQVIECEHLEASLQEWAIYTIGVSQPERLRA